MRFAYAKLDGTNLGLWRLGGPGLGNLLFPWARSVVAAEEHRLVLLAPTWRQIKVGPILRGERDWRSYGGLFRTPPEYVSGLQKLAVLARFVRVSEERFFADPEGAPRDCVVELQGMGGLFERVLDHHELIRARLRAMTRERHQRGLGFAFGRSIRVHVRLGDFAPADAAQPAEGGPTVRQPMAWYLAKVRQLCARLGEETRVHVFSDGTDDELGALLELRGARRLQFGSSLADLWALSRARVLVASGSTFSMWASYLGRMPVIWHPGRLRQRLYRNGAAEIESAQDEPLPESFWQAVERRHERHR